MKCKHEFALFTMQDGRQRRGWYALFVKARDYDDDWTEFGFSIGWVKSAKCDVCDAQLALGPSNDAGCEVEIRAAWLEHVARTERHAPTVGFTRNEDFGWDEHQHPAAYAHSAHIDKRLSGYLARELFTHDDLESRDATAWPWDPTRPIAGQYEEWLAQPR